MASKSRKPAPAAADAPMQVSVVRSSDPSCTPDCPEWIAAQGTIDANATIQFKKVLKSIGERKLPVLVDSAGGSVDDGLAIGRLIRAKGLDVVVSRTAITRCAGSDATCGALARMGIAVGRPIASASKCASSCAFVLAGGVKRYAAPQTFVGVHQFKTIAFKVLRTYRLQTRQVSGAPAEVRRVLVSEKVIGKESYAAKPRDKSYDAARRYFQQMGIGADVMKMIMATPNSQIHRLTAAELKATGLATDFIDGPRLLELRKSVTPQPGTRVLQQVSQ